MPAVSHFLRLFEQHHATFLAECDRLTKSDWLRWPMTAAYQGEWLLLPLISRRLCDGLAIDFETHRRLCPETHRILSAMPEVVEAGFSRLEPGTHIYPHVDADHSAFVRCHLGLRIPEGSMIRIDGRISTWQEGRCMVFDGHLLHETVNLSAEPRTILICDLDPAAVE